MTDELRALRAMAQMMAQQCKTCCGSGQIFSGFGASSFRIPHDIASGTIEGSAMFGDCPDCSGVRAIYRDVANG